MKLRLAMLVAALTLLVAPLTHAQTSLCNSTIIDQARVIHNPQIIGSAARTLINQGADVKVVIVDSISRYGSSLSDVERSLETTCPNWTTNGQRKANLFVVMVAPNDRAKNMFLGSYYNGAFDITSTYSQLSNTYFKNRQWELGLAAALTGTTGQATSFHAAQQRGPGAAGQPRTYTASGAQNITPTQQADTGVSGLLIFFIVLLGLGGAGAILYFVFRKKIEESETTTNYGTETVSPTPESYNPSSSSSYPRTYAAAAGATPPVQHTTIINNSGNSGDGLLTGLVVGEMLSRPSTVYVEPPAPTYVEPTPSYTPPEPEPSSTPDSTWEDTSSSNSDSSFGDSSSSDSSFGSSDSGSSNSDSSF